MSPFSSLKLIALAVVLVAGLAIRKYRKRNGLRLPPGPRGLPIIGNLLDIPKETSWLVYEDWAKSYGNVMSLEVFGQVIVILQSPQAVKDLFEKRGATYSDRPLPTFYEMARWDWFLPVARSDDQWRAGRRELERSLRPSSAVQYRPMLKAKTLEFLQRLVVRPENFKSHIEHLQSAINMAIVYGYEVKGRDDKFVNTVKDFVILAQKCALPGALWVNDFPFLRHLPDWLPGTGFKVLAKKSCELGEEVINGPLTFVKEGMLNGTAQPSMALDRLRECKSAKEEREIAIALGSLHAGGSDAMVAVLYTLFLVLVRDPSVQARAQAELDAATGGSRLPEFEDRPSLPYIDAICKELLRWKMISPLAFPHATTEDDEYQGYFIPKGSFVIANAWSILHDPEAYPDPFAFKPERFLNADGQVIDDPALSGVFGFGKRICPGRHLVDSMLFIAVALVLSTFKVGKAKDAAGNEIPVEGTFFGTLLYQPSPFECSIVPRNQITLELIAAAVE
ncbi:cytochrome P450 [Artomyces pyxidatus]|uniref:Cytochrome P450 n=1 Tax=Artomyces pyxidatus TaxID=48021 RepID=A0ACB8T4I1_9AGAM|nr:cytochrome P450 [Artomyces pyxidatus]